MSRTKVLPIIPGSDGRLERYHSAAKDLSLAGSEQMDSAMIAYLVCYVPNDVWDHALTLAVRDGRRYDERRPAR